METKPEIQFQGLTATPAIRGAIDMHRGRVGPALWPHHCVPGAGDGGRPPSEHHHKGGLYEVHVRLELPDGREVNVEKNADG